MKTDSLRRKSTEETKRKRGRPRKAKKKCVCEECHRVFMVKPSEDKRRFCKQKCEDVYNKNTIEEENFTIQVKDARSKEEQEKDPVEITFEKLSIDTLLELHEKHDHDHEDKQAREDSFFLQAIIAGSIGLLVCSMLCYYDICIKSYAALFGIAAALCTIVALPTLIAMGYKWVYKHFMGE